MIRKLLLGALLALALAAPAQAANGWFSNVVAGVCSGPITNPTLFMGRTLYYCTDASAAGAPFLAPAIATSSAGFFSVLRIGDAASTGAGACEFELYESTTVSGSTPASITGLSQISPDSTGDSVQDAVSQNGAANRRHLHGIRAVGVAVRVTVKAAGSEQCVVAFAGGV